MLKWKFDASQRDLLCAKDAGGRLYCCYELEDSPGEFVSDCDDEELHTGGIIECLQAAERYAEAHHA